MKPQLGREPLRRWDPERLGPYGGVAGHVHRDRVAAPGRPDVIRHAAVRHQRADTVSLGLLPPGQRVQKGVTENARRIELESLRLVRGQTRIRVKQLFG